MNRDEKEKINLSWKKVLLLAPLGVLGAVVGQIAFDLFNNFTDGYLSGFLVAIINKPISVGFWPNFETAILLFSWILGAGALALSFAFALQFKTQKALFTFMIGCGIGSISWLFTSYLIGILPPEWTSVLIKNPVIIPIITPYTIKAILPYVLMCCLLSLIIKDIRRIFFKMTLAGFLGAILGTKITLLYTTYLLSGLLESFGKVTFYGINPFRIFHAIVAMFIINIICLIFIRESLKTTGRLIQYK